jgi:membrane associated rhomboid family serine protease
MPDDLNPKRPEDLTPDAPKSDKPVHPLLRRPTPPPATPDGQPIQNTGPRVHMTFARPKRSLITLGLIVLNVAIFALVSLIPGIERDVVRNFANQPVAVLENAEYWRLFTSMFLHADLIHVMMNMLALYSLGSIMEIAFGHARYGLIYLLGGLAGSILSAALNEPQVFAVGASGAVFALFGAEAAHLYSNWRVMGASAPARLRQVIMLAVLNFTVGFIGNATGGGIYNIDNWAHIGGFAGGALLAYLIGPRYGVVLSADRKQINVHDARPFSGQIATTIYFGAGLLALLLAAVLIHQ